MISSRLGMWVDFLTSLDSCWRYGSGDFKNLDISYSFFLTCSKSCIEVSMDVYLERTSMTRYFRSLIIRSLLTIFSSSMLSLFFRSLSSLSLFASLIRPFSSASPAFSYIIFLHLSKLCSLTLCLCSISSISLILSISLASLSLLTFVTLSMRRCTSLSWYSCSAFSLASFFRWIANIF